VSSIDELLANSERYTSSFPGPLPAAPARQIAVVCCMDARIDVYRLLGLAEGQAHVLRNAGGVITDDMLRSLAISQRRLGTREILLIHHTECGLLHFRDDEFKADIRKETGVEPRWEPQTLTDLDADLRQAVARIQADPVLPYTDVVRGFVYDVAKGSLREVTGAGAAA
jgi:carbonic anhydrase